MVQSVKLLVVEDSAAVRARLVAMVGEVRELDAVDEARDAAGALEIMLRKAPDVVLLDIHLPGAGGMVLLPLLKALPSPPVVVVLTDDAGDHLRRYCFARGADFFFDKAKQFHRVLDVLADLQRVR